MTAPRLTALDFSGDPESAAWNSSGSGKNSIRSLAPSVEVQSPEGRPRGSLSFHGCPAHARAEMITLKQKTIMQTGAHHCGTLAGECGVEPRSRLSPPGPSLPWWRGEAEPSVQTNNDFQTTSRRLIPRMSLGRSRCRHIRCTRLAGRGAILCRRSMGRSLAPSRS